MIEVGDAIRFGNDDVLRDEEAVVTMILRHIESTP
jgi:very-short-patch-repair endonuclease